MRLAGMTDLASEVIGESPAIREVRETIAKVAPLPTSVLLTGRSGTGKEVAAALAALAVDRADKPFVPVILPAIKARRVYDEGWRGPAKARSGRVGRLRHRMSNVSFGSTDRRGAKKPSDHACPVGAALARGPLDRPARETPHLRWQRPSRRSSSSCRISV
ncbi:sigma 54-interacting transcriptional regulator [Mesorhizobium sp. CN2-181]|uniref:sigma 54-interacting transcriptional regulator n=1 Tax=Mesorhizobium TaxID=68287 RepID=UPI0032B7B93A